ncbi:IS66-like element accessory protein TnpA [Roseateles sp. DXS20W]|uniref:IS66-like element accessory protein TnpA n=1 Tax=Pelomonas lactea TaxID=3299030 RepID=A0ABW7GTA0_9BURK
MADQDTPSRRRRRDHSPKLKRALVRQCLQPGASVASIAMAHGINANLVFKWRREHRAAEAADSSTAQASTPLLLPITLASAPLSGTSRSMAQAPASITTRTSTDSIELDFAGARLRLRGAVDQESLLGSLTALRSLA